MIRALTVVEPGPLVSVQDQGRMGMQRHGVTEGGAIDPRAHAWGAALVGNQPEHASLEMGIVGGRFRNGDEIVQVAVTGASGEVSVDGRRVAHATTIDLGPRAELSIGPFSTGMYAYLSVAGGVDVPTVLGSRSTHVRAGIGGFEGRRLRGGDVIPLGPADRIEPVRLGAIGTPDEGPIRVVAGLHADRFSADDWAQFTGSDYEVTPQRDRQGVRLHGEALPTDRSLASSAVVLGDIQIGGDGFPTVLLVDRQPTGGYPRIATVIEADLARVVQARPGTQIRFERIELAAALELRIRHLESLRSTVLVESGRGLWSENLISGITVGDMDGHDAD